MSRSGRLSRRAFGALAAAGVAAAGGHAAAATAGAGVAATPTAAGGVTRLLATVHTGGIGTYGGALQQQVAAYIAQAFGRKHPGVVVQTVGAPSPDRTDLGYQAEVTAVLAGSGPDVLAGSGYQFPAFADAGALVPLGALATGLQMDVFAPGHIQALTRAPLGLAGLPAADGPDVVLVNFSALADLGLGAPAADWTYLQAARVWRQAAGQRGGKWHYGFTLDVEDYVAGLFGGRFMDATATKCLADSPQVLAAMAFLVPLVRADIVYPTPNPVVADAAVRQGLAACGMSPARNLPVVIHDMQALGVQWDFLPMPLFPAGRLTYDESSWYGLNAYSAAPRELTWELLTFLTLDRGLQQLLYRATLQTPNQTAAWQDWRAIVSAAAPVLKGKALAYFPEALADAVCNRWFRYNPYEVDTVLHLWLGAVVTGQISAASGLAQAAKAIDAMEVQAAAG